VSWVSKTWKNRSQGAPTTPIDAAGLNDLETRIGTLASSVASRTELAINVKDPAYGALGTGVAEPATPFQDAYDAVLAAGGGDIYVPAGTYLIDDANTECVILLTRDNARTAGKVRLLLDPGVTIQLSANTPRLADFNEVADNDVFRNFEIDGQGATIDADDVGGLDHVVIGTRPGSTNQTNISLEDITVRRLNLVNVAECPDGDASTDARVGVYLAPSGTASPANTLLNLVARRERTPSCEPSVPTNALTRPQSASAVTSTTRSSATPGSPRSASAPSTTASSSTPAAAAGRRPRCPATAAAGHRRAKAGSTRPSRSMRPT
jgi:polygalacturonase